MKYLLGFVLGLMVATAGQLLAQGFGTFSDERGRIYQYHTAPDGSVNTWGPNGERRTFMVPPTIGQKPC